MVIYNEDKTKILDKDKLDLKKGKLYKDAIIRHIPEVVEQEEIVELELVRVSEITGGKEYKEVIIQPYIAPIEAHDEVEDILVYVKNK